MSKRKAPKKKVDAASTMSLGYDGNPPILVDVQGITAAERKARITLKRNVAENPVDRMFHKGQITAEQCEAGRRLLADWWLGQTSPIRGVDYSAVRVCSSGAPAGLSDARCDAMTRYNKAMRTVGTTGRIVLTAIVIDGEDFQSLAARRGWNRKAINLALATALDMLVVHYRVARSEEAA